MDAVGVLRKTLVANLPVSGYVLATPKTCSTLTQVLENMLFLSFSSSVSFLFLVGLLFVLSAFFVEAGVLMAVASTMLPSESLIPLDSRWALTSLKILPPRSWALRR
jgi:hypothetical protein